MNDDPSKRPIGVFDSGVGGLSVLKALQEELPGEDFLYLGDTARVPYGTKTPQSVTRYAIQAAHVLVHRNIKQLVVACNTASAVALEALRKTYDPLPVVGVVEPGAAASCRISSRGHIAVIGTESTVNGGAYQRAIKEIRPEARVVARACTLFVALAEEGWVRGPVVEAIARRYLDPLMDVPQDTKPDCLVLGCTHFPVLATAIAAAVGPGVALVDSAATTAAFVSEQLSSMNRLRKGGRKPGETRFLATDGASRFARVGQVFLGRRIPESAVELVDL